MLFQFQKNIGIIIYIFICFFSAALGRREERKVSIAVFIQLILTFAFQNYRDLQNIQFNLIVIDVLLFIFFVSCALKSDVRWLLFATAFQFLSVVTHLAKMIDPSIQGWAYLTVFMIWGYGVLAALFVGTVQTLIRRSEVESRILPGFLSSALSRFRRAQCAEGDN